MKSLTVMPSIGLLDDVIDSAVFYRPINEVIDNDVFYIYGDGE